MTLRVHAAAFGPVRHEGREDSIGDDPVEVPDTYYYRRLIADGSLTLVSEAAPADPAEAETVHDHQE